VREEAEVEEVPDEEEKASTRRCTRFRASVASADGRKMASNHRW